MKSASILWALSACLSLSSAQPATYSIRTFAGTPRLLGDGGPATSATLWSPRGVSVDSAGNLFIADTTNGRIRKVSPDGNITTVAGSFPGSSGDPGPAASALLAYPSRAFAAPNGDLYIADSANNRLRRINATGSIATIAGTGMAGSSGDNGAGVTAQLSFPRDVAVDVNGNIYIADTNNMRVRRVTPQGIISTVAGTGAFGFQGDEGPAASAALAAPRGVAVDAVGTLYIADTLNHRIRKVTSDGRITTLAGGNTPGFAGDSGTGQFARLNTPSSVAVDGQGNVYVADTGNHRIRRISSQGIITTIAGGPTNGFSGDNGPAAAALLNAPQSVAVDAAGNVYIADTDNQRIRRINTQGIITTVAGSDPAAGDGGLAVAARLLLPSGIAADSAGNIYIADSGNNRVRRVNPQGVVSTVAGNGAAGYSGDNGLATAAQLNSPNGLAVDSSGTLYIADTGNHVVRRVTGGLIFTIAGTGEAGKDGDFGPAATAHLFNPSAVALDRAGNLLIADSGNNRIRAVSGGVIRNLAGDVSGLPGFAGDGGPALSARFDYPISLAIDTNGDVYVSDYFNNRIRRIQAGDNSITTVAGTGARGNSGDGGPAAQAQLYLPAGLAFDNSRNLFVADLLGSRIRVIGRNGFIGSVAGTGARGDSGDGGSALAATLASPRDLAIDGAGNIYFSDQDNHRVRKLSPSSVSIRTIVNSASGIAGPVAPGEAVSIFGAQLGDKVTFDGTPARVLYSSPSQVNVLVPDSIAGRTNVAVRVQNADLASDTFTAAVREAAPGLFTLDNSGSGPGAVINEDGTVNSAANPAPRGTIIAIYGTGQGTLNNAAVRIQGLPAEVVFSGQTAPGLYQVNARVPAEAFVSNRSPVELQVGSFAAQPGVTIAIR
jgi:uncharacterized protein (TIGR03437 family)